ncbi:putative costunolide synthase [Dioscorea sansibarensis]
MIQTLYICIYINRELAKQREREMENLLIPLLGLGLGLMVLIIFFSSRRRSKLPPGPWRLPILGNLHQLGPLPHRSLGKLAAKHGPLMHLQLGKIPTIIVSSPELACQILKTLDLSFASRPSSSSGAEFAYGGKLAKYSEHWRQVRKLGTLEIFSMKRVQSFRSIREEETNLLIQTIRRVSSSSSSSDVNLSKLFVFMSNNITSKEAFGKRFSDDGDCNWSPDHDIFKEIIELLSEFSLREVLPSLEWFRRSSSVRVKLEKSFKRMDQLFEREIDGHCSGGDGDDGERDLLDVLLKHQGDSSFGFAFTRDDIKAILQEIFFGGTDTTSSVLEWAISDLVRNPRVMDKAQDEVRRVVGNKGKVEESDLQQLRYLKLVINETLRLHPPAPLLVPRECREECNVQGYNIPVGMRVFVNAWAIMRDPNSWDNPEDFIPERFEESAINFKGQHFQFIPFGAGRRMCPGMQLGIATIEIALANILYHFNWELPAGTDMDMTETVTVVLHRKSPLILKAIPRIKLV